MDYRYYRGDGPELPSKWGKHIHKLRYIGAGMLVGGMVLPWLIVVDVLPSTFIWNFLAAGLTVLGVMLFIIGFVFNSWIDRAD